MALCGRSFLCLFLAAVLLLGFASCQDTSISRMESFYRESSGLPSTSIDSVKRFADKFGNYIYRNPAEKSSELYQPTEDNLRRAAYVFGYRLNVLTIGITIDPEWEGDIDIHY